MNYKRKKTVKLLTNICIAVVGGISYLFLFYRQCIVLRGGDYVAHNSFVEPIMNGTYKTMYPGYQLIVGCLSRLLKMDVNIVSVYVLTVCSILSIFFTKNILDELNSDSELFSFNTIGAIAINIVQPIFLSDIRPGYSSANGYISPTQIVCKPFAILVLLLFFRLEKNDENRVRNSILLTIASISSCIIKPVFAMAFVPAMGLYIICRIFASRNSLKTVLLRYVPTLMSLFATGVILLGQYIYMEKYSTAKYVQWDGGSLAIGFMVSWKSVVSSVPLSLVFAYFFPIVFTAVYQSQNEFRINSFDRIWLKMTFWYGIVSFIYMSFLYQTNGHEIDCNFRNAWIFTFYMVYTALIGMLIKWIRKKGIKKNYRLYILLFALGVHIMFGMALICNKLFM